MALGKNLRQILHYPNQVPVYCDKVILTIPLCRNAYAIGNADLYLVCPRINEDLSCYGDDDGSGYANGVVTSTAGP